MCLTLLCIGIPVLRPLYKVIRGKGSSDYEEGLDSGPLKSGQSYQMNNFQRKIFPGKDVVPTETKAQTYRGENDSDESILGPEYRQNGIRTTTQVTVSYHNKRTASPAQESHVWWMRKNETRSSFVTYTFNWVFFLILNIPYIYFQALVLFFLKGELLCRACYLSSYFPFSEGV